MGRMVDLDDLIDSAGVAQVLGLAQTATVRLYQHRYSDMPRPVFVVGHGRCKVWLRSEMEAWQASRSRRPRDPSLGPSIRADSSGASG